MPWEPLLLHFFICLAVAKAGASVIDSHLSGGFLPSPVKYFKPSGDLMAMESETVTSTSNVGGAGVDNTLFVSATSERAQQPRLGYPLYSGSSLMGGYSGTSPGVVSPVKLDLGGLLLGTVVGLGAVLLIPKIVHIFSYSHPYGRGEDSGSGVAEVMTRVDQALAAHRINTTACMERVACSLSQTSLDSIIRNPMVSFLVEGSRLERALQAGGSGQSCGALYSQCALNYQSITNTLDDVASSLQT